MDVASTNQVGLGNLNGLSEPSTPVVTDSSKELGRDAFLRLLTTQLQQQDPLNPQDNTAFVAQLAQFSALEQQMATSKGVENLLTSQESLANAQLSGLIGKEVVSLGNNLAISGGKPQPITFQLAADAPTVNITVRNAQGQAVDTVQLTNVQAGIRSFPWDGLDARGRPLLDGRYQIEIEAVGANGEPITTTPMTRGVVDGITFENGRAELAIGAARILPGEVVSIHEPEGSATPTPSPAPSKVSGKKGDGASYAPPAPEPAGYGPLDLSL